MMAVALLTAGQGMALCQLCLIKHHSMQKVGANVGDRGSLIADGVALRVLDTRKSGGAIVHYCQSEIGALAIGDQLQAVVAPSVRQNTARHHSADAFVARRASRRAG